MENSDNKTFKYCVVGLGVAGAFTTHFLNKYQQSDEVLVIDSNGIASGGSGSAGAFINPKYNSNGELSKLINDSFEFAQNFYKNNFSNLFIQKGTTFIPFTEREKEFLNYPDLANFFDSKLSADKKKIFTPNAGTILNVKKLVVKLLNNPKNRFLHQKIDKIEFDENNQIWTLNNQIKVEKLILTTGAYPFLMDFENYIKIRPIWGQRIDVATSSKNEKILKKYNKNIHKKISISTLENGTFKIGATHKQHVLEQNIDDEANEQLLLEARKIFEELNLKLENKFEIAETYGGARSGSFDYLPIVGHLVNSKASLEKYPNLKNGLKIDSSNLVFYKNLFVLNGLGGYGFVMSPMLAEKLVLEAILKNQFLDDFLESHRFFFRWAKRLKK